MLQRRDAAQMYEDMHRRPVAVIYEGKPVVRTNPRPPFRDDRTVSLREFCKYKCYAENVSSDWESAFDEWLTNIKCDGRDDPRILPLQIFSAKEAFELDELAERQRFRRSHRVGRALVDKRKRRWSSARPGTRHGREPQTVRGLRLDDGFHWDVTMSRSPVITSSTTIWEVRSGGYINVYPDGCMRTGKKSQLIWSAADSAKADEDERRRSRSK